MSISYQWDQEPKNCLFHTVKWLHGINLGLKFQKSPGELLVFSTLEVHDWVLISTMESSVSTKMADELYGEKEVRLVGVSNGKPPSPRSRKKTFQFKFKGRRKRIQCLHLKETKKEEFSLIFWNVWIKTVHTREYNLLPLVHWLKDRPFKDILTEFPRTMFNQLSGNPGAQSSWYIKLTILDCSHRAFVWH